MRFASRFMVALLALLAVSFGVSAADMSAPQTNSQIRDWYNEQVSAIPALNQHWIAEGIPAEQRAHRAHDIRHAARLKARDFMPDKREVADLQARDQAKYGNPDGPTFGMLVQKNRDKGLVGDAVYDEIIVSAACTDRATNEKYGSKPADKSP